MGYVVIGARTWVRSFSSGRWGTSVELWVRGTGFPLSAAVAPEEVRVPRCTAPRLVRTPRRRVASTLLLRRCHGTRAPVWCATICTNSTTPTEQQRPTRNNNHSLYHNMQSFIVPQHGLCSSHHIVRDWQTWVHTPFS